MRAWQKDEIFDIVKKHVFEVLPDLEGRDIQPGERLADLGANSVDRAEITVLVMESMSLNIPRLELSGVKNIGELVDVLYAKSQTR